MAIFRETVNCNDAGLSGTEAIFSFVFGSSASCRVFEDGDGREDGPKVSKGGTDAERTVEIA